MVVSGVARPVMPPQLGLEEAVVLSQVLVSAVGAERGVRCLAIKGPALEHAGLRGPKASVDADVLVEPAGFPLMLDAMADLGWVPGPVVSTPSILRPHARALRNPTWPVEVDLHREFPGFLTDSSQVFEVLWSHRATLMLAGTEVWAGDVVSQAAIAGLHYLRHPERPGNQEALDDLCQRFIELRGPSGVSELSALAASLGAQSTLVPMLARVGAPLGRQCDVPARGFDQWALGTAATASGAAWINALMDAPLSKWPSIIRRAAWLSDAEIDYYHRPPTGGLSRSRARLVRLGRGLRTLPAAAFQIARSRTARRRGWRS